MTTQSLLLMIVVMVVIWGGLIAAIAALVRRPEPHDVPEGGEDTRVPDERLT